MISLRPAPLATVSPGISKLLLINHIVRFTKEWPVTVLSGKTFRIDRRNEVKHSIHYILPGGDYKDINFGNDTVTDEHLTPTSPSSLYEINIGFKPGNYLTYIQIPAGSYINRLEDASMRPDPASATMRYLGALRPEDSPADDKRLFIYTVRELEPTILRAYVEASVAFDKITLEMLVNICHLDEIKTPTAEELRVAKELKYYTEIKSLGGS